MPKRDRTFHSYASHNPPDDLAVGDDGELYWKKKRIKRSNWRWGVVGGIILGLFTIISTLLFAASNLDKIVANYRNYFGSEPGANQQRSPGQ